MGQFYDSCPQNLIDWIQKQHVFWVGTAPLSPEGHVNVSPKGAFDCFHVIGPNKVWYEDLTGSGAETIAHLRENKRITILFSALEGAPRLVRLFGTGTAYEFGTPEYEELIPLETRKPGSRAAIVIDIHKVGSSCGYSIPFYDYKAERTTLFDYAAKLEAKADLTASDSRADKGLREYWATKNAKSIDGLPGVSCAGEAPAVPMSVWSREEVIAKGKEKARRNKVKTDSIEEGGSDVLPPAGKGPEVAAAFVMGVFATLLCVRMVRIFA